MLWLCQRIETFAPLSHFDARTATALPSPKKSRNLHSHQAPYLFAHFLVCLMKAPLRSHLHACFFLCLPLPKNTLACKGQIMIASAAWQERLGLALTVLLEDPEGATVRRLATDAAAAAAALDSSVGMAASGSLWIAPAPAAVRLFCLPYAGGVSENVFARRVPPACS